MIFCFGDHGGVLPRGKGYAYESGLHVPLVVRVPKNWKHLVDATLANLRQRLREKVVALPDLSLYPESYLVNQAFDNPVKFGQDRKSDIARLVKIADLSLKPVEQARTGIEAALKSDDPWERYWGLIACA